MVMTTTQRKKETSSREWDRFPTSISRTSGTEKSELSTTGLTKEATINGTTSSSSSSSSSSSCRSLVVDHIPKIYILKRLVMLIF